MVTSAWSARAANRAASLTTLARSAPEKPGVPRAKSYSATSPASGTLLPWTLRICSRPPHVGQADCHLAVKAAGAQQGFVQDVGTIGGGDDDDPFVAFEAVHFDQELVEGLFAFVVAAADACASPLAANGVDLVDEHDAGGVFFGLYEHVAHPGRAHANEHLDEVGAGDAEEFDARLARYRPGQQGLAGAWGADHEDAARHFAAELGEFLRRPQEVDDFLDFFLGFFAAGDVIELDGHLVFGEHFGLAFAKTVAACAGILLATHEDDPHDDQQQHGEPRDEDVHEQGALGRGDGLDFNVGGEQVVDDVRVVGVEGLEALPVGGVQEDVLPVDFHAVDLAVLDFGDEFGVRQGVEGRWRLLDAVEDQEQAPKYDAEQRGVV